MKKFSPRTIKVLSLVTAAGKQNQLCKVDYVKKSQFAAQEQLVRRTIQVYEIVDDEYLYVADDKDNFTKIKSLIIKNIRNIKILAETFAPKWEVKV